MSKRIPAPLNVFLAITVIRALISIVYRYRHRSTDNRWDRVVHSVISVAVVDCCLCCAGVAARVSL